MTDDNDEPDLTDGDVAATGAVHDGYTAAERRLLATLGTISAADRGRDAPPAEVWAGIDAVVSDLNVAALAPGSERPAVPGRSRRTVFLVGAAAAVLVVALLTGALILRARRDSSTVVAETALSSSGLPGAPAGLTGEAEVVKTRRSEVIRVDIGNLHPASGQFLELWLIKPDISGMVSLGAVRPDGTYDLPSGLRLADYPIVDVSTEPYDGNPAHSGDSLLRGVLPT